MITETERMDFLKRQGWKSDLPQEKKVEIESAWTDADIEMATALNF
jgi:hypothetical protein